MKLVMKQSVAIATRLRVTSAFGLVTAVVAAAEVKAMQLVFDFKAAATTSTDLTLSIEQRLLSSLPSHQAPSHRLDSCDHLAHLNPGTCCLNTIHSSKTHACFSRCPSVIIGSTAVPEQVALADLSLC